jgi:hypothetical protein
MYLPLTVEVKSVGEDVELSIGSWRRRMFFETAILVAAWMDECSRSAKHWAGRSDRRWYGIGTLHDASDKNWLNRGQPFDPNRVLCVNRDLLKQEQISVRQDGSVVVITIGTSEASIPHESALQISQWLRQRAKESQMRAGDLTRHWSKVKQEHERQHGPGVTRA